MADIDTDHLRAIANNWKLDSGEVRNWLEEAADEVDRLRAEVEDWEHEYADVGLLGLRKQRDEARARLAAVEALCVKYDLFLSDRRALDPVRAILAAARGEGDRG